MKTVVPSNVSVRLLSTNGQVLITVITNALPTKSAYKLRLNIPELSGRLYLVQFQTDDSVLTKRIIVLE